MFIVRQAVGDTNRFDFISTLQQQKPELNKETLWTGQWGTADIATRRRCWERPHKNHRVNYFISRSPSRSDTSQFIVIKACFTAKLMAVNLMTGAQRCCCRFHQTEAALCSPLVAVRTNNVDAALKPLNNCSCFTIDSSTNSHEKVH